MAITVSGNNPVQVTVASDTVTTNTTFNANAPNDRDYIFAANIIGSVNAGVTIGGFGLFLQSDASSNGRVAMTNNGSVAINAFTDALALEGNGGLVTYSGSGTVSNSGDGRALFLDNSNGHVTAVITNDITANTAPAVLLNTNGRGVASYTQAAGTVVSTAPNGDDVVHLVAAEGGIVANLNGTITGGTGLRAFSVGAITVNTSGTIDTDDTAILATGEGPGRVRINMAGGEVHATFGLQAIAQEGGGAVVNLSGGQIGSAAEPLDTAISVRSNGTAGNVKAITSTATTIFAGTGILADISNEDSTGNVIVTVNGGIDLAFFGVFTDNLGTGATNITINGSVVANTGIRVLNGAASVLNTGTITGTGGTAIELGGGNDRLTITRTSVINGNVLAQGGNDTLRLGGGGVGNFDVSDLGQQYQGFEAFNVVSGTWRLTGSSGENLNVLGGTVAGTAGINVLTVAAGGTVAPGVGAGAGRIETGQFFLTGGARLAIEIGGTAAGQSDQIEADGNVSLGGATLNLSRINGFVPTPGDNFLIIDHDAAGAINGTFGGLPEGATIFAPGSGGYRISYRGGDGNDVTLTALAFAAQGSGDFNGNGSDDLLWRHGSTGELLRWTIVDNQVQQLSLGNLDLNFAVVGTGDFDGNGSWSTVMSAANCWSTA